MGALSAEEKAIREEENKRKRQAREGEEKRRKVGELYEKQEWREQGGVDTVYGFNTACGMFAGGREGGGTEEEGGREREEGG